MRTLWLALVLAHPSPGPAEEPALPTPPRQAEAWTPPPSRLPRFLVKATATLFDQGLADPRGCDYRQIWIEVGNGQGGEPREVAATGWVLPTADGVARHAVAWNGLVYPLSGSAGPADLEADIRALPVARVEPRAFDVRRGRMGGFGDNGWSDEASSLSVASAGPLRACLLLRLGRADLAEASWAANHPLPEGERPKLDLTSYGVSYLSLAADLARPRSTRAVNAHLRGDDPLALADARVLVALNAAVEATASAMGFERPADPSGSGRAAPYLDFLGQAPRLLADQERRARERANPPPPPPPTGEGAPARIAGLIRDLDQVAVSPQFQPGGLNLVASPIVGALVAEGDAAVDPLLEVLRSDARLTRSGGPTVLGVEHAAFSALTKIIPGLPFNPPAPDAPEIGPRSRRAIAEAIRIQWQATRASPPVRR